MRTCKLAIIFICIFSMLMLFSSDSGFCSEKANRKLEMKKGHTHLLSFDEKIIRYRVGDKAAFNVEILPDIFNDRHEMLVKPLQEIDTNILVWTGTQVYNFDIEAKERKGLTEFFRFNSKKEKISEDISSVLGEYELDLPPFVPVNTRIRSFEIDLPPRPGK